MIARDEALRFAEAWVEAWNAHDLDHILAHYSEDALMTSPFLTTLIGEPTGTLKGKEQVRAYWRRALERVPDLHFDVLEVFVSVGSMVIFYKAVLGTRACEVFFFDDQGKVSKAVAHYNRV